MKRVIGYTVLILLLVLNLLAGFYNYYRETQMKLSIDSLRQGLKFQYSKIQENESEIYDHESRLDNLEDMEDRISNIEDYLSRY